MGDEKAKETPGLTPGPLSTALHSSPTYLLSYSPIPKFPMKDKTIT
jgi:hypothetical protein